MGLGIHDRVLHPEAPTESRFADRSTDCTAHPCRPLPNDAEVGRAVAAPAWVI
jgi:hypothetical protein